MQYSLEYLIHNSPYHKQLAGHFERQWTKLNDTIHHNIELTSTNEALKDRIKTLSDENSALVSQLENITVFGLFCDSVKSKFKAIKLPRIRIEW